MKRYLICISVIACCSTGIVRGQDSVRMAANKKYNEAGGFKRLWLGHHYRKDWATEVNYPVFNIDTAAGGLTPTKLGGGNQTKSLRLEGADGKEYVLRSINKDPSKTLPPELVGTFADDIVQDQISSANPYAPLVVAKLAAAAGVPFIQPQLVYVPNSPRLGEFGKIFAGTLAIFEARPNGNNKEILTTEELAEKMYKNPLNRVDGRAFLKARMFDMLIGDWDRHEDQWIWTPRKEGEMTLYSPVPRDRDQAFPRLDGIIPQLAARKWAIRQTQNFGYTIRDINGLNMAGHYLDRNFTPELTWPEWLSICQELQRNLTDDAIATAVRELPPPIYEISGQEITNKLKSRRDHLHKYVDEYYHFINEVVDVNGSGRQETFTVSRLNNDSTLLTISHEGHILFKRTFLNSETKELRLYGLGGNDEFKVEGQTGKSILVRVIGGEGEDTLIDSSYVQGGRHKTKLYDQKGTILRTGKETHAYITNDTLKNNYYWEAKRYDWLAPKLAPGYNPDDGIYIGGGFIFKRQQFGKAPYGHMQSVWGNYAIATGAWNFWYEGIFRETFGKWDLHLDATVNAPNFIRNFYGFGNETIKEKDDWSYYRARTNQVILSPSVVRQYGNKHTIQFGLSGQSMKVENTPNRFISDLHNNGDQSLFERKYYAGAFAAYTLSTVDNPLFPRTGVRLNGRADYTNNFEEGKTFFRLSYNASVFFTTGSLTLALRNGVATNTSDEYEFFQANTLGGQDNLRGYRRTRFAGKTALFNNAEVRLRFAQARGYILRGNYGLLAFFDNGRVWYPGEDSDTWHQGFGGGIWFLAYNRLPFTLTYGASKEENIVTVKAGFLF